MSNFKLRLNRYDIKIKLIVALILFALLILSFFFTDSIEKFLNLNEELLTHQVLKEDFENSTFSVNYIDVGQGNSTYIKLPDGKVLLIDGGDVDYGEKVAEVLKDDGVQKIDYLVATHSDSDHIAGLNYILNEFEVKNIYRPFQIAGTGTNSETFEVYEDEDLGEFYEYISNIENNQTKISRVTSSVYKTFITNIYNEFYVENGNYYKSEVTVFYDGLKICGENYSIEFFAPFIREGDYNLIEYSNTFGYATVGYGTNDSNNNSAIILVTIYDYTFLFTGDASWTSNLYDEEQTEGYEELEFVESLTEDERELFKNISVYLLGHHGSSFSSSEDLLELIDAQFFVVSVSENNTYGHPADDTLARISQYKKSDDYLLMTKDYGTITFSESNGSLGFSLETFEINRSFSISWYLLSVILYCFVIAFVFSLKIKKKKK